MPNSAQINTASTSKVHPSICREIQVSYPILTQWCQKHQIMATFYPIFLKVVKDFFVSTHLCFSSFKDKEFLFTEYSAILSLFLIYISCMKDTSPEFLFCKFYGKEKFVCDTKHVLDNMW